jgi:hypothetical protein
VPGWEDCANNCVFFQDPEKYGRALKEFWKGVQTDA